MNRTTGSKARKAVDAPNIDENVSDEDWAIRLSFAIHDASRLRRVIYDAGLRPTGVTRSQGWVLACLSRRHGLGQSDLAAALDVGKVALGGLIDRLENSGLVQRRPDARDRRIKRIFLTPAGRKVVNKQRRIARGLNRCGNWGGVLKNIEYNIDDGIGVACMNMPERPFNVSHYSHFR